MWVSVFLSASSGAIAIALMLLAFHFVSMYRLRSGPRGLGYSLLHGADGGMTAAELRSLPVRAASTAPLFSLGR